MKTRVIVCAIVKKDGRFLLGKKSENVGPYSNTWHLLGGGVDLENETLEEAMRRELKEEAGIEVGELKRVSFDEDREPDKKGELTHYIFQVFETEYKSGELRANDDIHELRWVEKEELKNLPLTRPSIKLFKELEII